MNLRYWLNPNLFPAGSPGQAAALAFVKTRYGGQIAKVNAAWGCAASNFQDLPDCLNPPAAGKGWACQHDGPPPMSAGVASDSEAFTLIFAKRYFDVVTTAIRRYDTNHLLFGMRGGCFQSGSHSLLSLFSSYIDVYDVHFYNDNLGVKGLLAEYELVREHETPSYRDSARGH